ncbi:hypothetical protein [Devosia sp. A449]
MTKPTDDIANLMTRLNKGPPAAQPDRRFGAARPVYALNVDEPDDRSIVLIIRTSADGFIRATIVTPQWHELEEGWDGPHTMDVAVPLADSYAEAFGYHAIAIDIESSQMWQPEWGDLILERNVL